MTDAMSGMLPVNIIGAPPDYLQFWQQFKFPLRIIRTSARPFIISLFYKTKSMTIYIKNMVCIRCKMVVSAELTHLGLQYTSIDLGQANILGDISKTQHERIRADLLLFGLELMEDIKSVLIERIKKIIIELVHSSEEPLPVNLSVHLSQQLHHNYTYMANIFSEIEGHTIEKFLIRHKIERVKELLFNDELNLTEIAFKMHYSSVAHLSSQFKKITGYTASQYKKFDTKPRVLLEAI
jgi:YesN/AraC family two-component response regulator